MQRFPSSRRAAPAGLAKAAAVGIAVSVLCWGQAQTANNGNVTSSTCMLYVLSRSRAHLAVYAQECLLL